MTQDVKIIKIQSDFNIELLKATEKFGPFNSAHEGYAVLLEEFIEFWDEIRLKSGTQENLYNELIQLGAMLQRFAIDLIDENIILNKK